jgi:hypothetical protein
VFGQLFPWLVAMAFAVVVYVLRELYRKRRQVNPRFPDLTMEQAWESWLEGVRKNPDRVLMPEGVEPDRVPEHEREELLRDLLEIERRSLATAKPRLALRSAVLETVGIALHLEALLELGETERQALLKGYQPGMDGLLRHAIRMLALRWIVLRRYAHWKYDDAGANDWFHHFVRVARPYIRERVRLARQFVLEMDESARRFAEIYDELLAELHQDLLKVHPKKRFPPPDLPYQATSTDY